MKRILTLSLAFALFLVPPLRARAEDSKGSIERYLVVGFDAAAQNTDVIAVVAYQHAMSRLTLLQIPRDTYYDFGGGQNKLNQLYPHVLGSRTSKAAREEAMRALADAVSSLLGVKIDRFVGVSIDDFSVMIDRIGGIPMTLEHPISYRDEQSGRLVRIEKGENVLFGKEAAAFVRYRLGYARGDLERIDAQKAFISAFLRKFGGGLSVGSIVSILSDLRTSTVTDLPLSLALRCGLRFVRCYPKTDIRYLTLPGEPCMHGGVSYYVANRASCEVAIARWLGFSDSKVSFDRDGKLILRSDPKMAEIYNRGSVPYHVYTDAELRPARDS